MRALVVCSQFPFPPRNGVTIPIFNYISILNELGFNVDVLLLKKNGEVLSHSCEPLSVRVIEVEVSRNRIKSILRELCLLEPYACGFKPLGSKLDDFLMEERYDLVISSPISEVVLSTKVVQSLTEEYKKRPFFIAAISDCYTAEIVCNDQLSGSNAVHLALKRWVLGIRGRIMRRIEPKILSRADMVFVQSSRDKAWLRKIGGEQLCNKVEVVTNGVNSELFSAPLVLGREPKNFCFVADLNTLYYKEKFVWLYKNVWAALKLENARLFVYTRKLRDSCCELEAIFSDDSIQVVDRFLPDIRDIYSDIDVAFAPIFKSYGFINKVGESMAAGVPVIGDKSAFNGIKGFQNNRHGIVANTAEAMCAAVNNICQDQALLDGLKINARELALAELNWKAKKNVFELISRRLIDA